MAWQYVLIGIFLLVALAFLFIYLDARKKSKESKLTIYDLNIRNKCYKRLLEQDGFTLEQLKEIRWILADDLKKVSFEPESNQVYHRTHTAGQVVNYFYKRADINGLIYFALVRYTEKKPEFQEKYKMGLKYLADNKIDYEGLKAD